MAILPNNLSKYCMGQFSLHPTPTPRLTPPLKGRRVEDKKDNDSILIFINNIEDEGKVNLK